MITTQELCKISSNNKKILQSCSHLPRNTSKLSVNWNVMESATLEFDLAFAQFIFFAFDNLMSQGE